MRGRKVITTILSLIIVNVSVGAFHVNSEAGTRSPRSYIVYDYTTEQIPANGTYTLTLSENTNISSYSVINPDTRVEYDNSGVVHLSNSGGSGTGFIVGDHTIATAAHCIYDEDTLSYAQNMNITLYDANGAKVKTLSKENNTIQAHIPSWYVSLPNIDDNFKYDYALITVSEDLSTYEHFRLGEILDTALNDRTIPISVCGFPGDKPSDQLYIGTGSLIELNDEYFKYDTDTMAGESGGPVFVTSTYRVGNNTPVTLKTVIGINTYEATTFNQGNRMTPEMLQFYLNNPYNSYEE